MSNNTSDRPMTPVTVQSKPQLLSCGDKRACQVFDKARVGKVREKYPTKINLKKYAKQSSKNNPHRHIAVRKGYEVRALCCGYLLRATGNGLAVSCRTRDCSSVTHKDGQCVLSLSKRKAFFFFWIQALPYRADDLIWRVSWSLWWNLWY